MNARMLTHMPPPCRVSRLLNRFLLNLLTLGCLCTITPTYAYHYPWDQGHDTTKPNEPNAPGPCVGSACKNDPCNSKSKGSPVYLATGQFIWSEKDIELKGRPALNVTRTFNSHDPQVGLVGNGWSLSCDSRLLYTTRYEKNDNVVTKVHELIRRMPNGKRYTYTEQADGTFTAPGLFDVVTRQSDNSLRLKRRDGSYSLYNQLGRLQSDVDSNGNLVNYSYDSQGRLIQKADTNGRSLSYEYNSNGLVSIIQDHSGRQWQYEYDTNANLTSITDPLGGIRQYSYQSYQAKGDGQTYNQLTQITDETGVVETQVSYSGDRVHSYTDYENTFYYQYDTTNRRATKTDSQNSRWVFTYNQSGQYIRITAPLNRTTVYDRNAESQLTRLIDPSGTEYHYTYDSYGNRLTQTDTRGTIATSFEEEKSWPLTVTSRSGRTTTITYDSHGNPLTITDPSTAVTALRWSAAGDLQRSTNALGHQINITHNPQGMPLTQTDALNHTTEYQYDTLNNLIQITNPAGETVQYQYDALDRMIASIDGNGDITHYTYDAAGRITQVTAPNNQTVKYDYDHFGRLRQRTFYDGTKEQYQYRKDNLISNIIDPDGMVISMTYDNAKRLIKRTIGSQDTYRYNYNSQDKLTSISNGTGTVTLTYDDFGRKLSETVNGETTTYQYNSEDEITQLKGLGITQTHQFDQRGLLSQLDTAGNSYQYTYDALARLTTVRRNVTASTNQFDSANRLISIDHGTGQRSHQYQYDPANRISQWQGVADETRDYSYDSQHRITTVKSPTAPETYSYDGLGNRQNNNAQFDQANRITGDNDFNYTYDINGNRTQKTHKASGATEHYTYNGLNQLTRYQSFPDNNPASTAIKDYGYTYGPLGRRWSKRNNLGTELTQFYWSGSNLIAENHNGTPRHYILEGLTPAGFIENGETYHYLKDHLGTAHEVIDNSGTIVWQGDYRSFGAVMETVSLLNNRLRFAGQYFDTESGLHYNGVRYYSPSDGRFTQPDRLGLFDGLNTYTYVYNNPLIYTDPTGEFGVVGGGIGAIVDVGLQLAQNGGNFGCVSWGQVATSAMLGAAGAGLGAKLAGVAGKGKQFSHWIPSRAKNWPGFGGKLGKKFLKSGNKYNGNYVSKRRHFKHDNYAYGNVKGEHLGWGDKWRKPIQQLDRIPNVYKGAVAGGAARNAAGNASGSSTCGC